jgi:hypothetical protein
VHPVSGVDLDRVAVFAAGGLPAFVLTMQGEAVLHASAVEVAGRALAFVGASGMGKSTMAALCCAAGARLVTDDVLRVDLSEGQARCHLGAGELRLRQSAGELAAGFCVPPARRHTADGRDALAPPASGGERLPLAAIVVPLPDRGADRAVLQRLAPMAGLLALLSCPRLPGWADPATQADQMQRLATLVEGVDVYAGRIPWGPPFPDGLAAAVMGVAGSGREGPELS